MRFLLGTLVGLAACAAPSAVAPLSSNWTPVDAATGRLTAIADLRRLADQFPESALVQQRLLMAAFRAGNAALVRAAVRRLADMGYALAPETLQQLAPLLGPDAADLGQRMSADRREIQASTVFVTIPTEHRLVEGLAWDTRNNRLYAASIVGRELLRLGGQGWERVEGIAAGSLSGLAIDGPRRRLWMASAVFEQTPNPETAFRGLIALDLDTGRVVRRVAAPGDATPSDITIGPDGTVYVSDPLSGAVYRASLAADRLDILVPPGRLRSPQGLAVTADAFRLYVADYNYGIAIVDLATRGMHRLAAERPMMLSGIDGLLRVDSDLVGVQNGTNPRRIVRIRLDRGGNRAIGLEVIERSHRDWGEPTLALVKDGDLLYVADAQWERFGAGGQVNGAEPLHPTPIRILPLRPGHLPSS